MKFWCWVGLIFAGLAACGDNPSPTLTPTLPPGVTRVTGLATPMFPPTSAPPAPTATLTPIPLAAIVNGQALPLAVYTREAARCEAGMTAFGRPNANCAALALDSLIEQLLVEQAAVEAGLTVSAAEVESRLRESLAALGGPELYAAWLTTNLYTDEEYRAALKSDLLRAKMAAQMVAGISVTAPQVHAHEILVSDEATARSLLRQIESGADFATLALVNSISNSRAAGGDLGWFPPGTLTVPEVEEAAFALPVDQLTIIASSLGYHVLRVEATEVRPLSSPALQARRERAYVEWARGLRANAQIEIFAK